MLRICARGTLMVFAQTFFATQKTANAETQILSMAYGHLRMTGVCGARPGASPGVRS
jgi:hypothetical protein